MIIKETTDQDEIKSILFHPEIYPIISGGHELCKRDTILPTDGVLYLAGYDLNIFGLSCFHVFKDGLKFHPNILPEYKRQYAREFIQRSLDMVKSNIYIEIPRNRKRLYNFARKIGFDSIPNNKDLSDRILMRLL